VAGKLLEETPAPESMAQNAQRVSSLHTAPALPSADAPLPLTEGDEKTPAGQAAARAQAVLTAVTSGASLLHSAPPSLAQARERHHAAADRWNGWLLRDLRLAYGYVHLLVKAVLHAVEWATDSPPKLLIDAAFIAVLWLWH
jgi:hypothetical protein